MYYHYIQNIRLLKQASCSGEFIPQERIVETIAEEIRSRFPFARVVYSCDLVKSSEYIIGRPLTADEKQTMLRPVYGAQCFSGPLGRAAIDVQIAAARQMRETGADRDSSFARDIDLGRLAEVYNEYSGYILVYPEVLALSFDHGGYRGQISALLTYIMAHELRHSVQSARLLRFVERHTFSEPLNTSAGLRKYYRLRHESDAEQYAGFLLRQLMAQD